MKKLREFYIHWMSAIALMVALFAYLIPTHFLPPLKASGQYLSLVWILDHVTERWAIVVLLWLFERVIRKHLWKFLHPELDFSGKWVGSTKYTHVRIGATKCSVPFETKQEMVIVQDCLNLRLVPSKGRDFKFKSRAIDIQDDGTQLVYAYHVEYSEGAEDRPSEAYGYEWLDVMETPDGRRPQKLQGKFAQCAMGHEPVFSGEVNLSRE